MNEYKNGTLWTTQLWDNSVTTVKILDKNVTEAKLSDDIIVKLNAPIVTELDPLSVKLTWNQTIWWIKTFINPVVWVTPTANNHLTTKEYVDNSISSVINCMFNSTTVLNWNSVTAYQNNIVTYPSGCISQIRTCSNWNLSWTYTNWSCTVSYTYSWYSWSWWSCSVSCGWWNRTRNVTCQRSDWLTVSDSYCTWLKPINSQNCNIQACPTGIDIIYKDAFFNEIWRVDNSWNKISWNPENLTCSWHISIGTYTIKACNLWASSVWFANNSLSYWSYYQFGKSNFLFSNDYWEAWDWKQPGWTNLWSANDWWVLEFNKNTATFLNSSNSNQLKMKWPCPIWYHIPTKSEWNSIISLWNWWSNWMNLSKSLKLPFSGYVESNGSINTTWSVWNLGYYYSSSPDASYAYILFFSSSSVSADAWNSRSFWLSLRCMLSPYTYSWNSWSWWACSLTCWWWTQTRNVTCQRSDWVTVSDSNCTWLKPINSQNCNTQACCTITNYEPYRLESNCSEVYPNGINWPWCMTSRYCDNDFVYPYYNSCTWYWEDHTYTYGQFVGCY